jgi:hypothetical protein
MVHVAVAVDVADAALEYSADATATAYGDVTDADP